MATGSILLPIGAAVPPDDSASNAPAGIVRVKSSAAAPSGHFLQATFDASTQEHLYWAFRMPGDYASAPVVKVQYKMASATSGTFGILVRLAAVSDGDATDVDAKAMGTVNTVTAVTVPGTAGYLDEISSGTLSNTDSLAAGDYVILMIARDVTNDTATGDAEVIAAVLEYTTT